MPKDCPCSWCELYGDRECPRYNSKKEIYKREKEIDALMRQVERLEKELEGAD